MLYKPFWHFVVDKVDFWRKNQEKYIPLKTS